jgi:phosphoribosylformylglycinamidine synthase
VEYVWHKQTDIERFDCLVLPGGFSYGDYLRCGAIARFSPVMGSVKKAAEQGKLVIGICNGFQILCEAGLLPGALIRNADLQFHCEWVNLRVENSQTPFTQAVRKSQVLRIPISHGEGCYHISSKGLTKLRENNQILFTYCARDGKITPEANPNGSLQNIAGISNKRGNVMGMMPHPERCCESIIGGVDGKLIFRSIIESFQKGGSTSDSRETSLAGRTR